MKVPQVNPWLTEIEAEAAANVVRSGWITQGRKAAEFTERLNTLLGAKYGMPVTSGTTALFLALKALGVGPGDEVLVPDITFFASAGAVILAGAAPVLVDVKPNTFQIDVVDCERVLTKQTRAIMPVHLYGSTVDLDAVMAFAKRYNLLVVEDAAEALGVQYRGQHVSTFGDAGCFSFFVGKAITTGEGGYVVCQDEYVYQRLIQLSEQGRLKSGGFIHPTIGFNFQLTDLCVAIGLTQLDRFDEIVQRKRHILSWYQEGLRDVAEVQFLAIEDGSDFIPFCVTLICAEAHNLMAYLSQHEIQPRTVFYPLHKQPSLAYLGLDDGLFSNANYAYEHGVCLPAFATLAKSQVDFVCSTIRGFYS